MVQDYSSERSYGTGSLIPGVSSAALAYRSRALARSYSSLYDDKFAEYGEDTMKISDDEAVAVFGDGGKTREKLLRLSGAEIELAKPLALEASDRSIVDLELRGTWLQRERARKYCEAIMAQGTRALDMSEVNDHGDLTLLELPQDVPCFTSGRPIYGLDNFFCALEQEWDVLIFSCEAEKIERGERCVGPERLGIYGSVRGRRGAELKILSMLEMRSPGFFSTIRRQVVERDVGRDVSGTWGTNTMTLRDNELASALGKEGCARKKLERASQAVVQYVGHVALISGTHEERRRAKEYMKWQFGEPGGVRYLEQDRDDCTIVLIEADFIAHFSESRLGRLEDDWGTLLFLLQSKDWDDARLVIFGGERGRRGVEMQCLAEIERLSPGTIGKNLCEKTTDTKGFDTDCVAIRGAGEVAVLIQEERKLAIAAGAIFRMVGGFALIAGSYEERHRCREYIHWQMQSLRSTVTISDANWRDDCTEVHIPTNTRHWVIGPGCVDLREMEQEAGVLMFMALDGRGRERLVIFSQDPGSLKSPMGRMAAERLVNERMHQALLAEQKPMSSPRKAALTSPWVSPRLTARALTTHFRRASKTGSNMVSL